MNEIVSFNKEEREVLIKASKEVATHQTLINEIITKAEKKLGRYMKKYDLSRKEAVKSVLIMTERESNVATIVKFLNLDLSFSQVEALFDVRDNMATRANIGKPTLLSIYRFCKTFGFDIDDDANEVLELLEMVTDTVNAKYLTTCIDIIVESAKQLQCYDVDSLLDFGFRGGGGFMKKEEPYGYSE